MLEEPRRVGRQGQLLDRVAAVQALDAHAEQLVHFLHGLVQDDVDALEVDLACLAHHVLGQRLLLRRGTPTKPTAHKLVQLAVHLQVQRSGAG